MTKAPAGLSRDFAHHSNVLVALACAIVATGIFIIDVASLPLGVAAGRGSRFSLLVPSHPLQPLAG